MYAISIIKTVGGNKTIVNEYCVEQISNLILDDVYKLVNKYNKLSFMCNNNITYNLVIKELKIQNGIDILFDIHSFINYVDLEIETIIKRNEKLSKQKKFNKNFY